jgi:dienelactone hydrolase
MGNFMSDAAREPPHHVDPNGPQAEMLEYTHGGMTMRGALFRPASAARAPCVLVGHDAMGLGEQVRARAQGLAKLGYLALAYDLYGAEGFPVEEVMDRHLAIANKPGEMRARVRAALDALTAQTGADASRAAVIGFCQGGVTAMELARSRAPIRAAIGFHPGLDRPAGSADGPIEARVLMLIGDQDTITPPTMRAAFGAEMDSKGARWEMVLFGGVTHSFTQPDIDRFGQDLFRYDAFADRRSWRMALDLLEDVFA